MSVQEHAAYPIINVNSFNIKTDSLRMGRMTLNNRDNSKSIINKARREERGKEGKGKFRVALKITS